MSDKKDRAAYRSDKTSALWSESGTLRRELVCVQPEGEKTSVTVTISLPELRKDRQRWCEVSIEGLWPEGFSIEVAGGDDIQALRHAFQAIGAKLASTAAFEEGRLYWLHPDLGHGFG
jgi:hypothetical protein